MCDNYVTRGCATEHVLGAMDHEQHSVMPKSLELLHMFSVSDRDGRSGWVGVWLLCTFGCRYGRTLPSPCKLPG